MFITSSINWIHGSFVWNNFLCLQNIRFFYSEKEIYATIISENNQK